MYRSFIEAYGMKQNLLFAILVFTIFSFLCGKASSMNELIAYRAIQGFGASGIYTIALTIYPYLVPLQLLGRCSTVASFVYLLGSVLGVIFGGAIAQGTTWRWIFWLK